ncbi:AzlD family protein [Halomicrobium salinisoli]|uniref:AzlD family protein n=1 Tax=Halomicrobium salinisoli TaxID=2878391 RepID=UPI001CF060D1|nr:AzlD domain-containing protein [Halomicrobium salinisoli]
MSELDVSGLALVAIAGMAVGTYVTRAGGYWLVSQFELTPRFRAWLRYLPGAVLVSLIVPDLVNGGPAEWGAALGALVVAWRSGNILYAMLAGIGIVVVLRRVPVVG